jgi:glycosyltransferase involved in cell wall biosynthesis
MTLKVLTVLAGAPVGGAEMFFVSLSAALARAGLDVRSVLKPNAAREGALSEAGISYETAPFGSALDFMTAAKLKRVGQEFKPDVVLAFAGRAASFARKGDYVLVGRLGGYYNLANFRHCDYLVCNAPDLVRYVVEGGWPESHVELIPNFPSLPDAPIVERSAFGTPDDAPLALALGRLHEAKGIDILIRAAVLVPQLFVWIAGDGPERAKLERLVGELGLNARVKFLGWRNDRAGLFKAADLCVYPSREEPFGNVVVEAWSCGVPLVTTASTGPKWLVKDGEDAILTPVDDVTALAKGIWKVVSTPELRENLAVAGRKRVAAKFSESAIIARYLQFFRQVTGKAH